MHFTWYVKAVDHIADILTFWEDNEADCFTATQFPCIILVCPELLMPDATSNTQKREILEILDCQRTASIHPPGKSVPP